MNSNKDRNNQNKKIKEDGKSIKIELTNQLIKDMLVGLKWLGMQLVLWYLHLDFQKLHGAYLKMLLIKLNNIVDEKWIILENINKL